MSPETSYKEQRVLLLTPTGRDAALISRLLKRAGYDVQTCNSLQELCQEILSGAAAVILAEEGLPDQSLSVLTECLDDQPAWSDLPVIVLTMAGKTTRRSAVLADALKGKVNLAFLERPLRMLTFVSAVQSACRARARQYEIRALLTKATEEVETRDRFIAMLGMNCEIRSRRFAPRLKFFRNLDLRIVVCWPHKLTSFIVNRNTWRDLSMIYLM